MRIRISILSFLLFILSAVWLHAQEREIKQVSLVQNGQEGVIWEVSLVRFQKRDGGSPPAWSVPTWRVNLNISNYTGQKVNLGGLLAVIHPSDSSDDFVSSYMAIYSRSSEQLIKAMQERYNFPWGVDVIGTVGLWPISRLSSGITGADQFRLLMRSPGAFSYAGGGGGFGYVSPLSRREIVEELLFPFAGNKKASTVVVVAPAFRAATDSAIRQQIFIFDAANLDLSKLPQSDQELKGPKIRTIVRTVENLTAIAESGLEPSWIRILALNWLVEKSSRVAEPVLIRLLTENNETLLLATMANLRALRVKKGVVAPLTSLLGKVREVIKGEVIKTLGELGDSSIAATLRPLLKEKNLKPFVVEALGKLKDGESVAFLLDDVRKGTNEESAPASLSLSRIANEPAIDGLVGIASDKKAEKSARVYAFKALTIIRNEKALGAAVAVLGSKKEKDLHAAAVGTLSALMRKGNADARAALMKYAEERGGPARSEARQALGLPPGK